MEVIQAKQMIDISTAAFLGEKNKMDFPLQLKDNEPD